MSSTKKKPALGRGLSALLANSETDITTKYETKQYTEAVGSVCMLPVEKIEANPFQPRKNFEKEALVDLTKSIKEHGIVQPITVRKIGNNKYQLISGERRFRAAQIIGLEEVPVYIRIANDQEMLELALIENIQRQDLDAVEIAIGYQRLIEECNLTQEQLSERVGKDRTTVTNYLRLLKLPPEIQMGIRDKKLSMGHARALITIPDPNMQVEIYNEVIDNELSVRKTESLVRETLQGKQKNINKNNNKHDKTKNILPFNQQKIKEDLFNKLNTQVEIKRDNKGKGKIIIEFKSDSDLERIIELLDV